MRLEIAIETDRKSLILESDDTDRSGDVNDWSELFQWAVDFEARSLEPKNVDVRPMAAQESFKAGEVEATAKVVDYLRAAAEGRKMVAPIVVAATISALADDLVNGFHIDPTR